MLISLGENIEGYIITELKSIVFGSAKSSDDNLYRQTALKKACLAAQSQGANAIINTRFEIYSIGENIQEATVYANSVIAIPEEGHYASSPAHKVNLEAYIPKPKALVAEVQEANGYQFVACPNCGTKYKTDTNENGEIHIKGFDDVDDLEPGLQIYCLRCGTKFTVPGTK